MVIWRMNHHVPQLSQLMMQSKTLKKNLYHNYITSISLCPTKNQRLQCLLKSLPFFLVQPNVPTHRSHRSNATPLPHFPPTCCRMALLAASTAERRIGPMGPDCQATSRGGGSEPGVFSEILAPK